MAVAMLTSETPDHRPGRKMVAGRAAPDRRARIVVGMRDTLVRQIGGEAQRRAVAHAPMSGQQTIVGGLGVAEGCSLQPWRDLVAAEREQVAYKSEPCILRRGVAGPV